MTRRTLTLILALVALLATFGDADAKKRRRRPIPPPVPVTTDRYEALPLEEVMIPTRAGDVYAEMIRPDVPEGTRVPVILTYTPYALFLSSADDGLADDFVPRGYARVLAHVPGTGNSGGCWDYGGTRERESGYDLVEWLGTQPWSNGKVGMIGGSYDGTTANMAAVDNPPHLATIVPEVAIGEWYGYGYHGGVRYLVMDPGQQQGLIIDEQGFDTPAAFDFGFAAAPPLNPSTSFPARTGERMCPGLDKVEHLERGYDPEPDFDAFWQERSYTREASDVDVPVLVTSGWRDYNVKFSESTRWFEALPNDIHKMLLMDQVAHGTPEADGFNFDVLLHAWFDRYLYGHRTNIKRQPRVQSMANDGVIRVGKRWPLKRSEELSLFLAPDGTLSTSTPQATEIGTYTDPGTTTESHAIDTKGSEGDLLWFESAPLERSLRVTGEPVLDLRATTDTTSTHYTPVLYDLGPPVDPDQAQCEFEPAQDACTMGRGFGNARYRGGLEQGVDLVPGETYATRVRFLGNDWVVPAGHRIGLALMSSNAWWAVPDQERATNTILSPSVLRLRVSPV